ncbi:hypothetical protein MMC28_009226 [Mycoblastus sanguinarius]|nr:hypothetical protein [Mycoblastus sanguinarius]
MDFTSYEGRYLVTILSGPNAEDRCSVLKELISQCRLKLESKSPGLTPLVRSEIERFSSELRHAISDDGGSLRTLEGWQRSEMQVYYYWSQTHYPDGTPKTQPVLEFFPKFESFASCGRMRILGAATWFRKW